MILECIVIGQQLGSQFTDGLDRLTIKIKDAEPMDNTFRIVGREGLGLGDEFRLACSLGKDAALAFKETR